MGLIRWKPGTELMNLHSEMDRLFEELAGDMGMARWTNRASVPGFNPDEVSVTVDQGILTIDAQHREEKEKKEKNCVRQERFSGRLYRQIALGQDVTGDEANATFANGVLTVTVPLAARSEPRKIPVQAAKT
ncbi:MAG: hypothetical protein QOG45_2220 [Chloroflexota bacterium]|nr:hypothetical protein [Chloroflexota bacterium]